MTDVVSKTQPVAADVGAASIARAVYASPRAVSLPVAGDGQQRHGPRWSTSDSAVGQDGGRAGHALRALREAFAPRPPLYAPVSDNAVAAATAGVIELRSRLSPLGERERDRPAREVAREAVSAAAPFIQRDLLSRVQADRLWVLAWVVVAAAAAVVVSLTMLLYGLAHGFHWMTMLAGLGFAVNVFGSVHVSSSVRRQSVRARAIAERPLTGSAPVDESVQTVDLAAAERGGC